MNTLVTQLCDAALKGPVCRIWWHLASVVVAMAATNVKHKKPPLKPVLCSSSLGYCRSMAVSGKENITIHGFT